MTDETPKCGALDCGQPARMAIITAENTSRGLHSVVCFDDRQAPKKASRYCKAHGAEIVAQLVESMVAP